MSIRPVARGLFVCEQVQNPPNSKNFTLVNCFNGLRVPKFPSPPTDFNVFAVLTGGLGAVKMWLMVSRLQDNQVIYSREFRVEFVDRVAEARFSLRLKNMVFPVAGQYVVELLADREWVAQTVINVGSEGAV
jgi:hypothetical protein